MKIKRYGLVRKALSGLADTSVYAPEIVEMANGEFYRCADIDPLLEAIGAGGVSGRRTKTVEQLREDFEKWLFLDQVLFDPDKVTKKVLIVAWQAWLAASMCNK